MDPRTIERARAYVRRADALLIAAGAGMGVDSGLPDFRGDEGFWNAYPAAKKLGLGFAQLANPRWFKENPAMAWAFYGHRLHLYRETIPHAGFSALLKTADAMSEWFVFTSNVDGQFQKAGFDESRILECHGCIHYLQCTDCDAGVWPADGVEVPVDMEAFKALDWPRCHRCGATARPNILMFNDFKWHAVRYQAQMERFEAFKQRLMAKKLRLAIIEIGAGTAIPTVRRTCERAAKNFGAKIVRINPREYAIDPRLGWGLPMGGAHGVEAILAPSGEAS
jgi:NAD-dependent SIR2 family protein deacetylase